MSKHALLFVGAICLVVGLLLQFGNVEKTVQAEPMPPATNYDDIFKAELEKNLDQNHETVMSALEAQAATLARIEESVTKPEVEEASKEEVEEEVVSTVNLEPVLAAPVRMSSTRWSVGRDWNPSKAKLLEHLAEHGVEADESYTKEELHIMHDNVHNGYSAMGDATVSSSAGGWGKTKTVTRTYSSSRGGLFSGRLFRSRSYSSCAGGSCR